MSANDLLIVGLGNPGAEYENTRHNLGWEVVRTLAARYGTTVDRKRWRALATSVEREGRRVWLTWPQTYMNLSGRSVAEAVKDLEIEPAAVWLVYDELDLPLCRLRIRTGGSTAGHNGVASVMNHLKTPDFVRFRVGIGRPEGDGVRWVLGRWGKREQEAVEKIRESVADALELAIDQGLERAMEQYNRKGSLGCEEIP